MERVFFLGDAISVMPVAVTSVERDPFSFNCSKESRQKWLP